jgi:hypothetical protein
MAGARKSAVANVSNYQPQYRDDGDTQIFIVGSGPGRSSKATASPRVVAKVVSPHGGCARLRPSAEAILVNRKDI